MMELINDSTNILYNHAYINKYSSLSCVYFPHNPLFLKPHSYALCSRTTAPDPSLKITSTPIFYLQVNPTITNPFSTSIIPLYSYKTSLNLFNTAATSALVILFFDLNVPSGYPLIIFDFTNLLTSVIYCEDVTSLRSM